MPQTFLMIALACYKSNVPNSTHSGDFVHTSSEELSTHPDLTILQPVQPCVQPEIGPSSFYGTDRHLQRKNSK